MGSYLWEAQVNWHFAKFAKSGFNPLTNGELSVGGAFHADEVLAVAASFNPLTNGELSVGLRRL